MKIKKFAVAVCAMSLLSVFSGFVLAGGKIDRVQLLPMEKEVRSYVALHFGREDVIEVLFSKYFLRLSKRTDVLL